MSSDEVVGCYNVSRDAKGHEERMPPGPRASGNIPIFEKISISDSGFSPLALCVSHRKQVDSGRIESVGVRIDHQYFFYQISSKGVCCIRRNHPTDCSCLVRILRVGVMSPLSVGEGRGACFSF